MSQIQLQETEAGDSEPGDGKSRECPHAGYQNGIEPSTGLAPREGNDEGNNSGASSNEKVSKLLLELDQSQRLLIDR
jgi:hypothetical protein